MIADEARNDLIFEQGRLDQAIIDLIRTELRGGLSPTQAAAFVDTVFGSNSDPA